MSDALRSLLAEKARRDALDRHKVDPLEAYLTSPDYFGLTTATPLQRAICRVIDGTPLGEFETLPELHNALACDPKLLPPGVPFEVMLLSGIRTAKSLMMSAAAVRWTQVVKIPSFVGPGEVPRVSVVSTSKENAEVIFQHIVGNVMSAPKLKDLVLSGPTVDSITLRHPSGIAIEVCVAAGARAGATLIARWSCGVIFDEFPRMVGESESVINWEDQRRSVYGRILKGAQIVSIGSPWAPWGPAYENYLQHHGKPTPAVVFMKAPAWDMNPVYWTKDEMERMRVNNPQAYVTDVASDFATPEESLFTSTEIARCEREAPLRLPPDKTLTYRAAMDPGTRGNAWTLVIATRRGLKKIVAFADQKIGSQVEPLKPREVFAEWAPVLRAYGITTIDTDQYMADALKDIAFEFGLFLHQVSMPEAKKGARYLAIKAKMAEKELDLPPDVLFRADLQRVKRRPMVTGGYKIILPSTPDGRHCDYAPAFMLAVSPFIEDQQVEAVGPDHEAYLHEVGRKMKEERFAQVRKAREPWWKRARK